MQITKVPPGIDRACRLKFESLRYFIKDLEERERRYALYYEALPIDETVIFYESMSGNRMMDNPYAIFRQLSSDPRFSGYTHVWSIAAYEAIPEAYKERTDIVFVTRHTDIYLRYLASARHLVCNSVFPDYFVRKPGQKYLNTWHGIAYKRIGRDPTTPLGPAYSTYNMLQATHVLTPCAFMTALQMHGFSMKGVHAGQIAETGYPRIDSTLKLSEAEKTQLRAGLNINAQKQTVLYAPTWRGTNKEGKFNTETLENDIRLLSKLDANVIFMGHHIMLKHIRGVNFSDVIIPPPRINTNELLAIVDILITDYSSIFFDFMVTGNPIIHYMYDYNEYVEERGLNLDVSELPGLIAYTAADMIDRVTDCLENETPPSEQYEQVRDRFCPYEDGKASERVIEWFFFDKTDGIRIIDNPTDHSAVFWGGRLSDPVKAKLFLETVARTAQEGRGVALILARAVEQDPELTKAVGQLPPSVSVITRNGHGLVASHEEMEARKEVDRGEKVKTPVQTMSRRAYEREYRRLLGDARFEESTAFEDNSKFWLELARPAVR